MPGITFNYHYQYWLRYNSGAPRGSGVTAMTSEFAAMRVGSSSGRSSSRSVPYSPMSETQPQVSDKRGKLILLILSILFLFLRYCRRSN
jgi:hypothetical protein